MKTKKLIIIAVFIIFGTSAQAQIVSSRSDQVIVTQKTKVKKPRTFKWNIRAGYSFDNMTGGHDLSGVSGFDANFGISKPFGSNSLFWGIEAGTMTYGTRMKDSDVARAYGADLTPRIGIKIPFAKDIALNIYGGPYIGFGFDGAKEHSYKTDAQGYEYNQSISIYGDFDIGLNLGVELFINKNFFFDFHVKKGFISSGDSYLSSYISDNDYWDSNSDEKDLFPLKIVLGIGVQF